ncbi:glycoside hydrolase/deacetylase [Meredithblackwellia eburnea MCA 4105]
MMILLLLLLLSTIISADNHHSLQKRQHSLGTTTTTTTKRQSTTTTTRQPTQTTTRPSTTTRLAVGEVTATQPLPSTFKPGSTPPVKGAPPLPDWTTINSANWPALDRVPPIDSPQMKQWISQLDLSQVPNIPPTGLGGCQNTSYNAQAIADAQKNCWWTCGFCTRDTDITFCPAKSTWGVSYDDGPSPSTPKLLNYLNEQSLLATFFVVGSRALSRPEMLQTEYMMGHQLSVHTWAHSSLTTLTNEEIIAELAWAKAIIKAVTGVTPNTMRPPYGDIDDRVRYISLQLGLTPIIWTVADQHSYDTQDTLLASGTVTTATVLNNFGRIINGSATLNTGFIVLEHDLDATAVDLAIQHVIPDALAFQPKLTLEPIITCLGESLEQAYAETYVAPVQKQTDNSTVSTAKGGAASSAKAGAAASASASAGSKSSSAARTGFSIAAVAFAALVGGTLLLSV